MSFYAQDARANHIETAGGALITSADTLLVASRAATLADDPRAGVDINHGGGLPGFVIVLDQNTIQSRDD